MAADEDYRTVSDNRPGNDFRAAGDRRRDRYRIDHITGVSLRQLRKPEIIGAREHMTLQITEDLGNVLQADGRPPADAARELIVLELYREGRISRGKAAELIGESLDEFLRRTARLGIPYLDLSDSELAREIESADRLNCADGL